MSKQQSQFENNTTSNNVSLRKLKGRLQQCLNELNTLIETPRDIVIDQHAWLAKWGSRPGNYDTQDPKE